MVDDRLSNGGRSTAMNCQINIMLRAGLVLAATTSMPHVHVQAGQPLCQVPAPAPAPAQRSTPTPVPNASIISPDRTTKWNPGILADDQLGLPLGIDGLPSRTQICATLNPGDNIQTAINNCPEGQVVKLNPGQFTVVNTIRIDRGVVLRGSGSDGAPLGTTIVQTRRRTVIGIGKGGDAICYAWSMGRGVPLVQDGVNESSIVSVGRYGINTATNFKKGDLALIDLIDDATIQEGDCPWFKRADKRSASQRVEINSIDPATGNLTLSSPLHWNFKAGGAYQAQIAKVRTPTTRWAGVESLKIMGGSNPSHLGAMAGGIDISNAAYCWVKDVQTGGTIGGMHIALTGTYRCVVRDSYVHHSANYGFGVDCYGIVLRCGAAENLIENNISRYMNKPIQLNTTGGGNVIAYNYADNAWSDRDGSWQEAPFDAHCSFPHMELIEGNMAPHLSAAITHGNAGYLTFFRNYASSQFAAPAVWGDTAVQIGNVAAVRFDGGDIGMNVVGNVLGSASTTTALASQVYDGADSGVPSIFLLGDGGAGLSDVAATSMFRTGNYDHVSKKVVWANGVVSLSPSLYLSNKPAWWPAGNPWPWAGPDLTPMVGVLPAKARSDSRYRPSVP
jgi:hypothetical protein